MVWPHYRRGVPGPEPLPLADDVVLLVQASSAVLAQRILRRSAEAAGAEVRANDGYVFQHLLAGARSVSALGELLGVSQQGASKLVIDLERRGLVERHPDPDDARAKRVQLSAVGWSAVRAARRERAAVLAEVRAALGPTRSAQLLRRLGELSEVLGADGELLGRRLRP